MTRALIFLVVGPVLVMATCMTFVLRAGGPRDIGGILALAFFALTLPVGAIAGGLDAYLARLCTAAPRAMLTATVGAIVAGIPVSFLVGCILSPSAPLYAAAIGAASMGACSLLASYPDGLQEQAAASQT